MGGAERGWAGARGDAVVDAAVAGFLACLAVSVGAGGPTGDSATGFAICVASPPSLAESGFLPGAAVSPTAGTLTICFAAGFAA